MITWADVVACAPELAKDPALTLLNTVAAGGTETTAQFILAGVILQLQNGQWGNKLDLAMTLLAAHISVLTVRGGFGPTGAVIGEAVGSVSRQYANNSPMGTHPYWDFTPYGKQYKQLLKQNPNRICLVT